MNLSKVIGPYKADLTALCHRFGVVRLYAFGSVVTDRFDPDKSDLDLLVELEEMPPLDRGETLINLWDALEELFVRKVDLLTDQPIQNPYLRAQVHRTKQLIYDRKSGEHSIDILLKQ